MANYGTPGPLALASYVQEQGEMGRQRGTETRLKRLVGQAYGATDPEARKGLMGQVAQTDPDAAFALEGQFNSQQDRQYGELGKKAAILAGAPEGMREQVYQQLRPELESVFGMQNLPPNVTPEVLQTAQQLASVYGGREGGGGLTVRSSFVGADGDMYSIMSDGSVKAQGVGADRKLQAFDVPGVGPQVVDLRNATAQTVTPGGAQAPQGAPQASPASTFAFTPAAGAQGDPDADAFAQLPPDQQEVAARLLQQKQDFTIQGGKVVPSGMSGGQPMSQPAANRQTLDRMPISEIGGGEDRPAWVRPVVGGAAGADKPPSGYRARPDGTLEFIPGGPADPARKPQAQDKPLPVGALRLRLDATESLSVADGVDGLLEGFERDIKNGALDLGPVKNLEYQARNAGGMSTPQSQKYASFTAGLEKLRNDSLRLNKGVQTDGDAQRAWNELMANINDPGVVKARLKEIRDINARGVRLQREKLKMIDQNYQGKDAAAQDDISDLMEQYGDDV
jgi:hypothetical protein